MLAAIVFRVFVSSRLLFKILYETVILHVVWVFENMVLRIFGPKKEKVTGGWTKLDTKEVRFTKSY